MITFGTVHTQENHPLGVYVSKGQRLYSKLIGASAKTEEICDMLQCSADDVQRLSGFNGLVEVTGFGTWLTTLMDVAELSAADVCQLLGHDTDRSVGYYINGYTMPNIDGIKKLLGVYRGYSKTQHTAELQEDTDNGLKGQLLLADEPYKSISIDLDYIDYNYLLWKAAKDGTNVIDMVNDLIYDKLLNSDTYEAYRAAIAADWRKK